MEHYSILQFTAAYMLVVSLVAFLYFAFDKLAAKKHRRRIPEKRLLMLTLLGGASGSLLAMCCLRHKTRHWYFWVVGIIGLLLQLALLVFLALHI